jgi:hypothetical protein
MVQDAPLIGLLGIWVFGIWVFLWVFGSLGFGYFRGETVAPSGLSNTWRVVGASVQGQSHRRAGQACQDAHRWQVVGEILIVAVADGAGSASCAEIGSALATHAAVDKAAELLRRERPRTAAGWQVLLERAFEEARRSVSRNALLMELGALEFATTLILAVATPDTLAVGQVGDGAVIVREGDGSFAAVTRPGTQEFINETTFLTSPEYRDRAQWVVRHEAATGLALLSDGLQMLALRMPQGIPHQAFFAPLLQALDSALGMDRAETQLQKFLQSPPVMQRADDDLTLVLAVRNET